MSTPLRWLVAANAVWLTAGLVAYATRLPMLVGAALAAAVATPGLRALRSDGAATEDQRLWADRAFSYAVGTWAVLLVVILLPLITLEEGGNLWGEQGYWLITLVVASGGFLLMNAAAFRAVAGPEAGSLRTYALFHAALLLVAAWALWSLDHAVVDVSVAGEALRAFDLRMAPAFAAVPGLTWALAFWRLRTDDPGAVSAS